MKIALIATLLGTAVSLTAHAQSLTTQATPTNYADYQHTFSTGVRGGPVASFTLSYAYNLNNRFTLGSSLATGRDYEFELEGNIWTNMYHKHQELRLTTLDINAAYYFRENGVKRWGPLVRAGAGYGWARMNNEWDEIGSSAGVTQNENWGTAFARIGGYYQFAWNFREGASVGHILELGLGGIFFDEAKKVASTRTDGNEQKMELERSNALAEITYGLSF